MTDMDRSLLCTGQILPVFGIYGRLSMKSGDVMDLA